MGMNKWDGASTCAKTCLHRYECAFLVVGVGELVRLRQINGRARAVAAQAAIMVNQAIRSAQAVSQALDRPADRVAVYKEHPGRTGPYRPHPLKAPPRSIPPARLRPSWGVTRV